MENKYCRVCGSTSDKNPCDKCVRELGRALGTNGLTFIDLM